MPNQPPIPWKNLLESGNRIFVGSNAAVPNALMNNLIENSQGLHDIEVVHILTMGENVWAKKEHSDLFKVNAFFLGPGTRDAVPMATPTIRRVSFRRSQPCLKTGFCRSMQRW